MTQELLKTGKHKVTAITRADSKNILPEGVEIAKVDYNDHPSLVHILKGHDAFIITIAVYAQAAQEQLIRAAIEAGVPWILPNEWGVDTDSEPFVNAVGMRDRVQAPLKLISESGTSAFIAVSCGYWYEWSLSFPDGWGFDFANKTITILDDGEARVSASSWPQVGRAVAALLSLKVKPDGPEDKSPCLEQFKNKYCYPESFRVNQKELLASVLRATNTTEADWNIQKVSSQERFDHAMNTVRQGDMRLFVRAMYTRAMFPDEAANVVKMRGSNHNHLLGLSEESIDTYTQAGIDRAPEMAEWLKGVYGGAH